MHLIVLNYIWQSQYIQSIKALVFDLVAVWLRVNPATAIAALCLVCNRPHRLLYLPQLNTHFLINNIRYTASHETMGSSIENLELDIS